MNLAVFPGQGSQHVGMLKEFYENFKLVRELFEEASDSTGLHIKKLCFDGPESDLQLTQNTQPCLLTSSIASYRVVHTETGFKPHIAAGHSLGEYSALVANQCIPFSSAVRWVMERGIAMQKAVPEGEGSMLALMGFEDSQVETLCTEAKTHAQVARNQGYDGAGSRVQCELSPANFNSPGQTVVSGSIDAIEHALKLIKADPRFSGKKAIPLSVSAPFHCSLMADARTKMESLFQKAQDYEKPLPFEFPYIPNTTARVTTEQTAVFDLLVEQINHPVMWRQSIENALQNGVNRVIEFGPGKVLQGLCKRIAAAQNANVQLLGVNDLASLDSLKKGLSS